MPVFADVRATEYAAEASLLTWIMQSHAAQDSMYSRVRWRGADARWVFRAGSERWSGYAHGRGGQGADAVVRQAYGRVGLPADAPLVGELAISCNRNVASHAAFCDRTLSDAHAGYPGPLAGILAGLRSLCGTHLLVAPCDLPAIEQELLRELQQLALAHPGRIAVVRQGERLQPLLCVLPRTLLAAVDSAWAAGERSPSRLWQRLGICELACREDDPRLLNFNCPEVLLAACQSAHGEWGCYVDHR